MAEKPDTAGKVFFLPEVGPQYLFFVPTRITPNLKYLNDSMWRAKRLVAYGDGYRTASSVEALEWLRSTLGKLSLSKEVYNWYIQATQIIPIQKPEDSPLFDFQLEAVGFLQQRTRAMLSLSPGLGKTLVSSTAASLLCPPQVIRRVLVVAPASLLYMWKAELEKWTPHLPRHPRVSVWHKKIDRTFFLPKPSPKILDWVITNPETVVRKFADIANSSFDVLILDESILYKNKDSQRTKSMRNLAKEIPIVWELTGSPATRYLDDLWSQFHILDPKAYTSYWRFTKEYCLLQENNWGAQILANKLGAEDLIKKRFRDIYFARSQEEVLDIPDWLFEDIDIPMTSPQEKAYNEMLVQLRTILKTEENTTVINVTNHLAKVIRLIQLSSNPLILDGPDSSGKWDAIIPLMEHYPGPYIIWTSFIRTAHELRNRMIKAKLRTECMIGETKPAERQAITEYFQKGNLDVLIIGQAVGSFGLTLTKARTAIYLERTFDGSYFQSLHRFRRIGTEHRPIVINLRSIYEDGTKTIDHLVHGMLDYRVDMIQNLTVGMLKGIL